MKKAKQSSKAVKFIPGTPFIKATNSPPILIEI
jgi:hypothetical protein